MQRLRKTSISLTSLILVYLYSSLSLAQISVSAGGDVNFNRDQVPASATKTYHKGNTFEWSRMTQGLRGLFNSDLNFANVECVVSSRALSPYPKTWNFISHPNSIEHLANEGFNLFSMNNNHTYDYGQAGLDDTYENMTALSNRYSGVNWHGVGYKNETIAPREFYKNGIKVAFASIGIYGASELYSTESRIGALNIRNANHYNAVLNALKNSDAAFKVLSIHQGVEGSVSVTSAEKNLFRRAVDEAGVNFVIGHHPHVAKPVEIYNGSLIAYSLGNLLLIGGADIDGRQDATDYGLVLKTEFDWSTRLNKYYPKYLEAHPLKNVHSHPKLMTEPERKRRANVLNGFNQMYSDSDNPLAFP